MQIAVVEIPTSETDGEAELESSDGSTLGSRVTGGRVTGESGSWSRIASEAGGHSTGTSGVFPALSEVDDLASANEVWRWIPPAATECPEGCMRLVVFQRGAKWPQLLARDLSGGATTCIVSEELGDGLSGLVHRVARRASNTDLAVIQLIWISGETRRTAPVRFVRQLAEAVGSPSTVLVVQAQASAARRRTGRRRRTSADGPPGYGEWVASVAG